MRKQIMPGLAAGQSDGVSEMINVLTGELKRTMSITGCRNPDNIDPSILWGEID